MPVCCFWRRDHLPATADCAGVRFDLKADGRGPACDRPQRVTISQLGVLGHEEGDEEGDEEGHEEGERGSNFSTEPTGAKSGFDTCKSKPGCC